MRRRTAPLLVLVAALSPTAACGADTSSGSTISAVLTTTTTATATTTTLLSTGTPSPPSRPADVGPSGSFTFPITDKDGYRFDVSVRLSTSDLGGSVEHDKPGYMSAAFTLSISMEIANKTPGRTIEFHKVSGVTAPLGNPKFLLSAVWDQGSPVCTSVAVDASPCALLLGFGYATQPITASSTAVLETRKGHPSGHFTAGLAGFPENSWPQLRTALAKPHRYVLTYDGGKYQRFGCDLNERLGVVLADDKGQLDCTNTNLRLVPQPST
ncbi:hypothetical protein SUDANB95_02797 [Actinosynnema sp. ALI-1.44]